MKRALNDLAVIFSGVSFRSKVKHHENGEVAIIQMRDLEDEYTAIADSLVHLPASEVKKKYLLRPGDVLILSKGTKNRAVEYQAIQPYAAASSAFFVIRPDQSQLLPGFLTWYLNLPSSQIRIQQSLTGTYTLNLNRSALESFVVPLPSLQRQEIISNLNTLMIKEQNLTKSLLDKRLQLLQGIMQENLTQTVIA